MSAAPRAALPSNPPRYLGVRMVLTDTAIMMTPVMHQEMIELGSRRW